MRSCASRIAFRSGALASKDCSVCAVVMPRIIARLDFEGEVHLQWLTKFARLANAFDVVRRKSQANGELLQLGGILWIVFFGRRRIHKIKAQGRKDRAVADLHEHS